MVQSVHGNLCLGNKMCSSPESNNLKEVVNLNALYERSKYDDDIPAVKCELGYFSIGKHRLPNPFPLLFIWN